MKTTAVTWKSLEKMQAHERVLLIDLRDDRIDRRLDGIALGDLGTNSMTHRLGHRILRFWLGRADLCPPRIGQQVGRLCR